MGPGEPGVISFPDPPPKSRKRVWCSERHFLSHGGQYGIENVTITFIDLELVAASF